MLHFEVSYFTLMKKINFYRWLLAIACLTIKKFKREILKWGDSGEIITKYAYGSKFHSNLLYNYFRMEG